MSAAAASASGTSGAIITEVVLQGIRRFGDVRRFTFGPGYNVVHGLASSGKTTVHDVLLSLLFATPAEGEKESFASLLPQGKVACRAGMTLSLGGELWRVLKDYQQGVTTLSRFNVAEKKSSTSFCPTSRRSSAGSRKPHGFLQGRVSVRSSPSRARNFRRSPTAAP